MTTASRVSGCAVLVGELRPAISSGSHRAVPSGSPLAKLASAVKWK